MEGRKRYNTLFVLFLLIACCIHGCSYYREDPEVDRLYYRGFAGGESVTGQGAVSRHSETRALYEPGEMRRDIIKQRKEFGVVSVEKNMPGEIQIGKPFSYTIKISNIAGEKVRNLELTETLPYRFKFRDAIPGMKKKGKEGTAKWFIGDLHPAETRLIQITGVPVETGDMPFCTDVTYDFAPLCTIARAVEPKLIITRSAPPDALLCDRIPVRIVVTNTGTGAAYNLQIRESLPPGVKTVEGKSVIVHEISVLRPGESKEIAFSVKAEKTGTFSNAATVVADDIQRMESGIVTTVIKQPLLAITKTGPEKIYTGRNITYTIAVSNKGDGPAASAVIEEILPDNASFISATHGGTLSGNMVRWELGTLLPKDSRKVQLTLQDKGTGMIKNTATVKAVCAEPVSAMATTEVLGIPAILLEVVDVEDPIEVGKTETYRITVTNQGSAKGNNIRIVCMLEKEMEYVASSGPTEAVVSGDGRKVTFAPLPTLAPREKATWTVNVKAVSRGDVRFRVQMTEDRLTRPVEETEATTFYEAGYFDIFDR